MSTDAANSAAMSSVLWCRLCRKAYPASEVYCPVHHEDLEPMADLDAVDSDRDDDPLPRPRTVCWRCGERSPNPRNTHCTVCKSSLSPPALVITFRDGHLELRRGQSAELGRSGSHGYVFERFPNVSRRHAVVGVEEDGRAWVRPMPTAPNGTFVNGHEIRELTTLAGDDEIRFAAKESGPAGTVRRPEFE